MSIIDSIASNRKYAYAFLIFLSAFFFIGIGHIHLFDWDEINFAESAREMIESGDYLRVQINYLPFWEKPPFFFWLQVASMKVFGIGDFAARLPNALFGLIYLLTFYTIGKRHFSAKFGLIWALVFFASLLPHLYFKSGIIDPVFNFFIFLSIYFMIRVLAKDGESIWKLALFAGIFSGLSVITKGPVGFLLLGLTFTVYVIVKRFRVFPSLLNILVFLAGMFLIIGCWISLEVYQNGFEIISQFIEYQIELFRTPVAGHEQPFYYHFIVVGLGCFPMSIFALPYLFRKREATALDFKTWMLVLFWVVLILFSITTTKIIHYSSMTYAPLSFIAALVIYRAFKGEFVIKKYISLIFLVIGVIVSVIMIVLPLLLSEKSWLLSKIDDPFVIGSIESSQAWTAIDSLGGFVFLIFLIASFVFLRKGKLGNMILMSAAGTGLTLLIILYTVMPKVDSMTQGPVISFYEEIAGEDCYIETYYKSYAPYFYARTTSGSEQSHNRAWLVEGEIDKPVYMITQISNLGLESYPEIKLIKVEGGFRFYRRDPIK